jgi:heme/copper-type cytochrome/quinol oxidase subunit 4
MMTKLKNNTIHSLSITLVLSALLTILAHFLLPSANQTSPFLATSTFGLFIVCFAVCSIVVRVAFWWIEDRKPLKGRTVATFKLRSQELADVRLLLSQGKANEALAYMQNLQNLSGATKQ